METNQTEECECGHEESDHIELYDTDQGVPNGVECVKGCNCHEYRPKDAQYYADLDYDARAEKWERSRE